MSNLVKLLTGVAGLAAVAGFATPAAAQYYPGYGYNNGGVVGAIISGVIGGGQYGNYGYGSNDRYAVDQCSRAVEARLGGYNSYGAYGRSYGGYGYNNYNGGGRVVGITRVERRSSGIRVRGVAASGAGYGGYGSGNLTFSCKVDYRGRITDLDFNRQNYGYNGYYRGY
jgi:hypothetical protein